MNKLTLSWNASKNLLKGTFIFAIGSMILIGCKKEIPVIENSKTTPSITSTAKINPNLNTENGVMIFETQKDFDDELMNTYKITNADRIVWENSHNFKSLHTMYNEICKAEYEACLKPYENISDEQAKSIVTPEHTALYYEALKNGIVKVVKNNDGTESQALNCSQMNYAPFLSADGIVAIENDLFQYQNGKAKQYKNAKPTTTNIEKIKSVLVSNENEGIKVVDLKSKNRASATISLNQSQTTPGQSGGIMQNGLYRSVFDLYYTFNWNGIAINRASYYSFNSYAVLKTEKKKNSLTSTYYIYPGDHYIQSQSTPMAILGGVFTSNLVDVNGNQIYNFNSSGPTTPAKWGFPLSHTINANDAGQGNGQYAPTFASASKQSPLLSTWPLGLTQSYFGTDPSPYLKWQLNATVPGGGSGFTLFNVKN